LAATIDQKNWPKTMDASQDYFSCVIGEIKAPLACVIREVAAVPPKANDLATTA
jgi:hypothetical protein